jgi:taurine dioxygenase
MKIKQAAGALGAFVEGVSIADAVDSLDAFDQIYAALVKHQVVFLRDQSIAPEVLEQFGCRIGEVMPHPAYPTVQGTERVQVLESTAKSPSKIEVWHSDMTFTRKPPSITLLHGRVIPAVGGDTLWASAQAAFAALSVPMQRFLDGLQAEHDFRHGFAESLAEPGGAERLAAAIEANPPVQHPLVRTHPETGLKSIYVNRLFTTRVVGLTPIESQRLLEFLYQHVVMDEFTVRLAWEPDTIAMWDNRSTQHKPINDFGEQHRLLHRLTIVGDLPC